MSRAFPWCDQRSTSPVAAVAAAALDSGVAAEPACPTYRTALEGALQYEPPPYGMPGYSDLYRDAAQDAQWLAISLMSNAEREGDGAKRLWSLAACAEDDRVRHLLKRHAVDESRHSQAYLALLDLTFPGAVSPQFRTELGTLSPRYSMSQSPVAVDGSPYARTPSVDDFVQMNIAEIRTAIHHTLQREAIEKHCPPDNAIRARRILDVIFRDELAHVAYSAKLIEGMAEETGTRELQDLFCRRVCDFNRLTRQELGEATFSCACRPIE
jgi:hypothetical protein